MDKLRVASLILKGGGKTSPLSINKLTHLILEMEEMFVFKIIRKQIH